MKSSVRTLASLWKSTLWKAGQLMAAGRVMELQVAKGPVFGHFPWALSRFHCLLGHEVHRRLESLETTGRKQTMELGRELKETQSFIYEASSWRNSPAKAAGIQALCCSSLPRAMDFSLRLLGA